MARNVVLYVVVHQPRRLKLPAQPIPEGASIEEIRHCLFDEAMNERYFHSIAASCYYPATARFLQLARQGLKLSIGFSISVLRQAEQWDPPLLDHFKALVSEPNVELIGVEPYHSFLFLFDIPLFIQRMRWMRTELERIFGKRPNVTDTSEMCMSPAISAALEQAGFAGGLIDGRHWVLDWRQPTHLYQSGALKLLPRHPELSDDVGYRFSNRSWSRWPLLASSYAQWLHDAEGELAFVAWDYETFGEHQRRETGIFEFLEHLHNELHLCDVHTHTPSEIISLLEETSFHLPLPGFPSTWAGSGGMEFFLGNSVQQALFQLMLQAHGLAQLTKRPDLLDLALWLEQSDHLHLIQWLDHSSAEADVSTYFTPHEWRDLGPAGIIHEQQQVYQNFIHALESFLPGKLPNRNRNKKPTPKEQELLAADAGIDARYS